MTLPDLECLSKIFNDTEHRAAFLRQISFFEVTLLIEIHVNPNAKQSASI